jgi:hypothetical protein
MIEYIVIGGLGVAVLVLWARMRFWRWAAKKRAEVILTQGQTKDALRAEIAGLKWRLHGFTYIENAWDEYIEEETER